MAETLSFLNIGVEIGGFNNSFQKSQDLYNKQSNILLKQSPVLKDKVDYLNGIKEEKHDNYIVATEKQKNQTLTEKNKFLNEVNERKKNTINTYKDVQNLADFSRLIEKENDEGMKALEEILGTENLYKCVLLTIAGTASEVGKGMFDALKIGEGIAEGMLVNENKSVPTGMRLEAMLKGIGIDSLRAMAIIPGAKTLLQGFAKILNKIKLPVNSNIGGNLIGNEIGAVGDIKSLRKGEIIKGSLDIKIMIIDEVESIPINAPHQCSYVLDRLYSQGSRQLVFLKENCPIIIKKLEKCLEHCLKTQPPPPTATIEGIKRNFVKEFNKMLETYNVKEKYNSITEINTFLENIH